MKNLKIVMVIIGIPTFLISVYNITYLGLPNQWFGIVGGGFLLWLFFNIGKFSNEQ